MLTAVYTVLVFCLIISIHELGHFVVAKLTGMTVHEFSIGMGPKLFSFSTSKTAYSLRLLPIGGYVKLEGEDEQSDDQNAFCNKSAVQRLLVLVSGAFMNFVLGFVIFVVLFSVSGGITTNSVGSVIKGSSFSENGILPGDKIIRLESNDKRSIIHDYNDINYFLTRNGSKSVIFTFKRGDNIFEKILSPTSVEGYKGKLFGFSPEVVKPVPGNVIPASFRQSVFVVKVVLTSFSDMIRGTVSISDMSGPVGIVREIGNAAEEGMKHSFLTGLLNVLSLSALISINLGVVNLLPLPALDGGRILFILIEIIRGKAIDKGKEGYIHFVGFALLILLMIAITFFDIGKLLS